MLHFVSFPGLEIQIQIRLMREWEGLISFDWKMILLIIIFMTMMMILLKKKRSELQSLANQTAYNVSQLLDNLLQVMVMYKVQ